MNQQASEMYAHVRVDERGEMVAVQTVEAHCRNAAKYAADCLAPVGLANVGYLPALLHDLGKARPAFQDYLLHGKGARGSVIHSFAGCRMLLERFHGERVRDYKDVTAELLAYAVGAHHGLFDCVDEEKQSGFLHRTTKEKIEYAESVENFLVQCAGWEEIDALFAKAHGELSAVYEKLTRLHEKTGTENAFYLGMLARLILSAVIEGDRRDTAEFMSDMVFPERTKDLRAFWSRYLEHMENKLAAFSGDSEINRSRSAISQKCRDFAENPSGVYRLNVPTGAGKTLAGLRYALAHAKTWGKQRVIFTAPLLTVLDQNSAVIRSFLGDDSIILEHHSNVIRTDGDGDRLNALELAEENWNAPVILTTMVQLLNTLFDGRTSCIRRFQALCDSVIVIDEVQTVPDRMLTLFNLAVNFLSEFCGAAVLLCSATQPALETVAHPLLRKPESVVPYEEALWRPFRRTHITDAGRMTLEEIAAFAQRQLEDVQNVLVICNKKGEAVRLFQILSASDAACFHLSASMCVAHRRDVLERIQRALEEKRPMICVSTQVVEAGVDISFQRVIRLTAGMDSIVQSAGRCNRHGELPEAVPVYVVRCKGEKLSFLREIQNGKDASEALLKVYERDPARFGCDLTSDAAIAYYYRILYQSHTGEYHDFMTDYGSIFCLLSCNTKYLDTTSDIFGKYMLNQAFRLAGRLFRVFDADTEDAVVPYGEGAALIRELLSKGERCDPRLLKDWLQRAKPYMVSLYEYQKKDLGAVLTNVAGVTILQPGIYNEHTGFSLKNITQDFLEV